MVIIMKTTIKVILSKSEYKGYVKMLTEKGFNKVGTRLLEDSKNYVKIYIK